MDSAMDRLLRDVLEEIEGVIVGDENAEKFPGLWRVHADICKVLDCDACGNRGYLHATRGGKREIQRCDACGRIESDAMATARHAERCAGPCEWRA